MKNKKGQTEQEIQAEILRTYAAWKSAKGTPLEPQARREFYAVDTVVF